jgi:hypothetical protein
MWTQHGVHQRRQPGGADKRIELLLGGPDHDTPRGNQILRTFRSHDDVHQCETVDAGTLLIEPIFSVPDVTAGNEAARFPGFEYPYLKVELADDLLERIDREVVQPVAGSAIDSAVALLEFESLQVRLNITVIYPEPIHRSDHLRLIGNASVGKSCRWRRRYQGHGGTEARRIVLGAIREESLLKSHESISTASLQWLVVYQPY